MIAALKPFPLPGYRRAIVPLDEGREDVSGANVQVDGGWLPETV